MRPERLIHDSLLTSAAAHPSKLALVTETGRYTYGELLDASRRLAHGLQIHGLERGERVAIQLENGWTSAVAIYGTLLAGGVIMLLHPQTPPEKLRFILQDSAASFWLTETRLSGWLEALPERVNLKGVILSSAAGPLRDRTFDFDAFLGASLPSPAAVFTIPLDLAALIYTSGTTGVPKGVMMNHQSMVFSLGSVLEYLALRQDDHILSPLAFAFSYGLYQLFMNVTVGATLHTMQANYPAALADRLIGEHITVFPAVPTLFASLIALAQKGLVLPSLRCVTNAAAALPVAFVPQLQMLFPNARIFNMYGQTECKRVSYLEPELLAKHPNSVGRAIPGTELFLLSETGEPVPHGEPGILYVRGPHVMMGYWQQPELTARTLRPGRYPGEQILCTGDYFHLDENGLFYFVSRSDDIIKTRGEKVSPNEIEEVLYTLPGVLEAAVIGVPHPLLGEAVSAYLVLTPDASLSEQLVKRACMARLEAAKIPTEIHFIEALPKTASGKVRRQSLRDAVLSQNPV